MSPNWQFNLPGFPYSDDNPDGFLTRDEVIKYLDDYVNFFYPPVRLGIEVNSVEGNPDGNGFVIKTNTGTLEASNVIAAAGTFQKPKIPGASRNISSDVVQLHSGLYRNPNELPQGSVLVVGSAQSGCQIAEELYKSGRKVCLATGSANRVPRRYRGRDFTLWFGAIEITEITADKLPSPAARFMPNPQVSGKDGGHSINLHQFAKDGVTLMGSFKSADGSKIWLEDNLRDHLSQADIFEAELKKGIDDYIEKNNIDAPEDNTPQMRDGYDADKITELDIESNGIRYIIWATGYEFDFSWVKFPIFDEFGYPVQTQGVTKQPGLYFLGLHWLHKITSGLLAGVGEDAANVVQHIQSRS